MDIEDRLTRLEDLVQQLVRGRAGPEGAGHVAGGSERPGAPHTAENAPTSNPTPAEQDLAPGGVVVTTVAAGPARGEPAGPTIHMRDVRRVGSVRPTPSSQPPAAPAPNAPRVPRDAGMSEVLARLRAPGRRVVCAGVGHWEAGSSRTATNVMCWDGDEPITFEQRRTAALCQALASEPRLSMLCELVAGPRSTSDLTAATGLDRGQLYHHLRDLFLQGLVEQPERGRYRLTDRGETVVLLTAVLATSAPEADEPFTLVPEDVEDAGPA